MLLKKDAFSWTPEEAQSFQQIKESMCKYLILETPNFTKTFIMECDASRNGIGDVLMQEGLSTQAKGTFLIPLPSDRRALRFLTNLPHSKEILFWGWS